VEYLAAEFTAATGPRFPPQWGRTDESLFPPGAGWSGWKAIRNLPVGETTRKTGFDGVNRTSFVLVKYVMDATVASTIWRAEKENYF
jgi:hypothetical protein